MVNIVKQSPGWIYTMELSSWNVNCAITIILADNVLQRDCCLLPVASLDLLAIGDSVVGKQTGCQIDG